MAQILKDETRKAILNAATLLIIKHGLYEVSMRQIANESNMTAGNLYRYFPSKDELVKAIYEPFLNDLNIMLSKYSNDQIELFKSTIDLKIVDLEFVVQSIVDELVGLYLIHQDRMTVMMQNNELGHTLIAWFASVLKSLDSTLEKDVYYEMLSISIFNALGYIFNQNLDEEVLKSIIYRYLSLVIRI